MQYNTKEKKTPYFVNKKFMNTYLLPEKFSLKYEKKGVNT